MINGNGIIFGNGIISCTIEYTLDVGIFIFGTPSFSIDNSISEFKAFIEDNSLLKLRITKISSNYLIPVSDMTAYSTGTEFPDLGKFQNDSNISQYLTHKVNIILYDCQSYQPSYGGLTWLHGYNGNSICVIPFGSLIDFWGFDATWGTAKSSAMVHELLHGINLNSDSCPSLGYNDSDGWKSCYIHLFSTLTINQYVNLNYVP
jgi:hypothetical protein